MLLHSFKTMSHEPIAYNTKSGTDGVRWGYSEYMDSTPHELKVHKF